MNSAEKIQTGRCLCGKVRYQFTGEILWQAHCHCESCRRQTSSPLTSFFGIPKAALTFTGEQPASYESSPGTIRKFCRHCGTPIAYLSKQRTDQIDLYACTLDDHQNYQPSAHIFWPERVGWLHIDDELEKK